MEIQGDLSSFTQELCVELLDFRTPIRAGELKAVARVRVGPFQFNDVLIFREQSKRYVVIKCYRSLRNTEEGTAVW